jgi:integrase
VTKITADPRIACEKCGQEGENLTRKCSHCRGPMRYKGKLFHDLRRSAARDMIRAGVAQTIAMKITGHKTATMFQRYNIADTEDLREALSATALYREAGREKVRSIAARR